MSDVHKPDVGILTCWISDVGFLQVRCRIFTSRMSDFNKSDADVGFLKVGCRISDVGFLKSDVGWHL